VTQQYLLSHFNTDHTCELQNQVDRPGSAYYPAIHPDEILAASRWVIQGHARGKIASEENARFQI
jgi:hypothetical protein